MKIPISLKPRRRVALLTLAIAAGAAVTAIVSLHDAGGANVPAKWVFNGVPGVAIAGDQLTTLSAEHSGVSSAVRQVVGVGQGLARLQVLASSNADGAPCFASRGSGTISTFHCLSADDSDRALIPFVGEGGAAARQIDYVTVAGVVRGDVARVELAFVDGTSQVLHLGRWRSFGVTVSGGQAPQALRAFDASGTQLQSIDVGASPLCGGAAGACDTG